MAFDVASILYAAFPEKDSILVLRLARVAVAMKAHGPMVQRTEEPKGQRADGPLIKAPLKPTNPGPKDQRSEVAKGLWSIERNRLATLKITEDWIVDRGI
jgi:hypothetical protein